MPDRCGRPAGVGRCILTAGHTGKHWPGAVVRRRKPPPLPTKPMPAGLADVATLKKHVRAAAIRLAKEGVRLP